MSRRNNILAIFERKATIDDHLIGEPEQWIELCKAWIALEPEQIASQRTEFVDATQTKSTRRSIVKTIYTTAVAEVTTACRMKVAKFKPAVPEKANDDANFRIFGIDAIVNVGEQNRELQMGVIERI